MNEAYPGRNLAQNSWDFGGSLGIFGVHIKQFPTGYEALVRPYGVL
jgi:hypothetical protein